MLALSNFNYSLPRPVCYRCFGSLNTWFYILNRRSTDLPNVDKRPHYFSLVWESHQTLDAKYTSLQQIYNLGNIPVFHTYFLYFSVIPWKQSHHLSLFFYHYNWKSIATSSSGPLGNLEILTKTHITKYSSLKTKKCKCLTNYFYHASLSLMIEV